MFAFRSKKSAPSRQPPVFVERDAVAGKLVVRTSGSWSIAHGLSDAGTLEKALAAGTDGAKTLDFDCSGVSDYDSSLICWILKCVSLCRAKGVEANLDSLPENMRRLATLALGTRGNVAQPQRGIHEENIFFRIGERVTNIADNFSRQLDFLGETVCAFGRLFRGKARCRRRDTLYFIQCCGIDALPIISLISFITGMILAYIGAMQLERFGAIIYVVSLIAIAMFREMGVIMTSVIMCGRTGSAFAAQIGSMQASEEISALRVLGISPVDYLVLPRILALTLMMPLLTLYSNVIGLIGGFAVVSPMGVTLDQFWNMTVMTMSLNHLFCGLAKSVVFGWLVAWAGCYRGMVAGKSSLDVGEAATSASVLGITLIVIGDGIFAVLFNILGF